MNNDLKPLNTQKIFLDESFLIFLIQLSIGWYFNQDDSSFHIQFDYLKNMTIESYIKDLSREALINNDVVVKWNEKPYEKVAEYLEFFEKAFDAQFTFRYSDSIPYRFSQSMGEVFSHSPEANYFTVAMLKMLSFEKINQLKEKKGYQALLGVANLDQSCLYDVAYTPLSIAFNKAKDEYDLHLFLYGIPKEKIKNYLSEYIKDYKNQRLNKPGKTINSIPGHIDLLMQCINDHLGKNKNTNNQNIELTKNEIAYSVLNMPCKEHQVLDEYRFLEFLLYLQNQESIVIESIEWLDESSTAYNAKQKKLKAVLIDGTNFKVRFKLLKPIEEIVNYFSNQKARVKVDRISRTIYVNDKRCPFRKETPSYQLILETLEVPCKPVIRKKVIAIFRLKEEKNEYIKSDNNNFILDKIKKLRKKLGVSSEILELNDGNVTFHTELII